MNPEQWSSDEHVPADARSDLYALGVTLYQWLTGQLPYGEVEPYQAARFRRDPKPPSRLRPDVPIWLDHVVLKAVALDPQAALRDRRGDGAGARARRLAPARAPHAPRRWSRATRPRCGRSRSAVSLLLNALLVVLAAVPADAERRRPERVIRPYSRLARGPAYVVARRGLLRADGRARPPFSAQVRVQRICITRSITQHRPARARRTHTKPQQVAAAGSCFDRPIAFGTRPPPSAPISPIIEPATAVVSGQRSGTSWNSAPLPAPSAAKHSMNSSVVDAPASCPRSPHSTSVTATTTSTARQRVDAAPAVGDPAADDAHRRRP